MRPVRKLILGLWLAVFLVAGIRFGASWKAAPHKQTANTGVHSTVESSAHSGVSVIAQNSRPAVAVGDPLPAITMKDLNGEPRALSAWSGRTLLLNFWATWCAPCRKEMPLLEQFQQSQDPTRMQVIGLAIDRLDPVLQFIGETGVTYPNLVGEMDATRIAEQFVGGFAMGLALPLSVITAPDGKVLAVHMGEITASDLEQIAAVADGLAVGTLSAEEAPSRLRLGDAPP